MNDQETHIAFGAELTYRLASRNGRAVPRGAHEKIAGVVFDHLGREGSDDINPSKASYTERIAHASDHLLENPLGYNRLAMIPDIGVHFPGRYRRVRETIQGVATHLGLHATVHPRLEAYIHGDSDAPSLFVPGEHNLPLERRVAAGLIALGYDGVFIDPHADSEKILSRFTIGHSRSSTINFADGRIEMEAFDGRSISPKVAIRALTNGIRYGLQRVDGATAQKVPTTEVANITWSKVSSTLHPMERWDKSWIHFALQETKVVRGTNLEVLSPSSSQKYGSVILSALLRREIGHVSPKFYHDFINHALKVVIDNKSATIIVTPDLLFKSELTMPTFAAELHHHGITPHDFPTINSQLLDFGIRGELMARHYTTFNRGAVAARVDLGTRSWQKIVGRMREARSYRQIDCHTWAGHIRALQNRVAQEQQTR